MKQYVGAVVLIEEWAGSKIPFGIDHGRPHIARPSALDRGRTWGGHFLHRIARPFLALALASFTAPAAWAVSYAFPGALPSGCSSSGGGNYACGALSLATADTVTINAPIPATITVTGTMAINGAKINQGGAASNAVFNVSGGFTASAGAVVNASITANTISSSGAVNYGGSLSTPGSGAITIGAGSSVAGSVQSSTGAVNLLTGTASAYTTVGQIVSGGTVTLNSYNSVTGDTIGYLVSAAGHNTFGGSIKSTSTYVSLGGYATVGGSIVSQSYVDTGSYSLVNGSITSNTTYIDTGVGTSVGGSLSSASYVDIHSNATVGGSITAQTYVSMTTNSSVSGSITAKTTIAMGSGSSVSQCVRSTNSNTINIPSASAVGGACCGSGTTCGNSCVTGSPKPPACSPPLDHLVIQHASGQGLTCSPATVTILACADSGCSSLYSSGLSGTLTATGSGMTVGFPAGSTFTIPSGSSSTTLSVQGTKVGAYVIGTTGLSVAASAATSCNFGSPSCTFTVADSGFVYNIPNHAAEASQAITVSAVKKSDSSSACVPAFASTSKSVNFSCVYANPGQGSQAVRVGGVALNAAGHASAACDGGGRLVPLSFNASGVANTTVQYADVGRVQIRASYGGSGTEDGLLMTGDSTFTAAPASFAFSAVSAGPIKAGTNFSATVTALNTAGQVTPNFGAETSAEGINLSWAKHRPSGSGATAGSFAGGGSVQGFSAGVLSKTNLAWSDVGTGDLSAVLSSGSYLGSGLSASGATGTSGAVGPFIPYRFDSVVVQACQDAYTYSGQPFDLEITARNATGGVTYNYDGTSDTTPNFAKTTALTNASGSVLGSLSLQQVEASRFAAGKALVKPAFTFANKHAAPAAMTPRATDTDAVSSSQGSEGTVKLRSGRLAMSNAFGSEKTKLEIPIQAQYWSGVAWVLNSLDNCTAIPAAAVARSNYVDNKGVATTSWTTTPSAISFTGGHGILTLSAPSPVMTGSVDLALNLGSAATDQSCLSGHPATTGAAVGWLRSRFGTSNACAGVTAYDRDPSAKATFGIYSAESKKVIHIREMY